MALRPRCECQVGTETRPPYRAVICPRSALPGSRWCYDHQYMDAVADAWERRKQASS